MVPEDQLARIVGLLDRRHGLDALYLFGSEASGRAGTLSDVDLAALFERPPAPTERLALQDELAAILGREVDLVDLVQASPILAMQVLRHGRLLHEGNRVRRVAFVARVPGMYEDVIRTRREAENRLLERFRG
jgi:predicted nucleotidyltransferase